ncbi:MAG: hypothetical protein PHE67_05725 [Campylobacterales bacterium]|nr:hypothetical protein [Campylobacterales bacterium]
MPKYRVQIKQGSKTMVQHIEASSVDAVLALYQTLSTAKVTEILKVEYENLTTPPADDMQYYSVFKGLVRDSSTHKSRQIIINNIKLTKSTDAISTALKEYIELDGKRIDGVVSTLLKRP